MSLWCVIVNPAAGKGQAAYLWPDIEALLQSMGFAYTVRFTQYPGHAIQLIDDAVLQGYRQFLGVGGDGTCHELVNGLLRQPHVPSTHLTFGVLPIGTSNDWARHYAVPRHPQARLRRLLQGATAFQDVGVVSYQCAGSRSERFFVNVAGMAYDAYIVRKTAQEHSTSRWRYLLSVGRYLFSFEPPFGRLWAEECTAEEAFYTINVGICRYSGAGMQLVPHARSDDGLLAVTYAPRLPRWEVLLQTRRFYNGTLLEHPRICGFQTRALRVEHLGEHPIELEADGEFLGETPVAFAIRESALRVAL